MALVYTGAGLHRCWSTQALACVDLRPQQYWSNVKRNTHAYTDHATFKTNRICLISRTLSRSVLSCPLFLSLPSLPPPSRPPCLHRLLSRSLPPSLVFSFSRSLSLSHIQAHAPTCTHTYTRTGKHTHAHAHTHTYIHTHTDTHKTQKHSCTHTRKYGSCTHTHGHTNAH